MKQRRIIVFSGVAVLLVASVLCCLFWQKGKMESTKSLAKQVEEDYSGMEKVINQAVEKNEDIALSSNPYDYIKDNSYYTSLVNKGVDVLPILESKLENDEYGEGLLGYITAIAIQDITDCDLKQEKEFEWATANEFKNAWGKFKEDVDDRVNAILSNKKKETEKKEELAKYGVYAATILKEKGLDKKYSALVNDYKIDRNQYEMLQKQIK